MKFAAVGRTRMLLDATRRCMQRHRLVLVGTAAAAPEYACGEEEFAAVARDAGCPFFVGARLSADHARLLQESGAQAVVSVNWPTVMPRSFIDACAFGVINAHAGDLPQFRGNATPNWAILQGESRIVVTLHQMDEGLDSGPVLLQREYMIGRDTYVRDIYAFLETAVPDMFAQVLDGLEAGSLEPRPQRADVIPLRCLPRLPRDSEIDWSQSAEQIARVVRAGAAPFSGAFTFLEGQRLSIWKADPERMPHRLLGMPGHVVERRDTGEVVVLTGDGLLVLREASYRDDRRRAPAHIITSTRVRLGLSVTEELLALRRRVEALEAQIGRSVPAGVMQSLVDEDG